MAAKKTANGKRKLPIFALLQHSFVDDPDKDCQHEEASRWHHHNSPFGPPSAEHLVAPDCSAAKKFPYKGDNQEDVAVTHSTGQSIDEGEGGFVLEGKSLNASHDDTVGNNESHVGSQLFPYLRVVGFKHYRS